jgi:hypothetical protein
MDWTNKPLEFINNDVNEDILLRAARMLAQRGGRTKSKAKAAAARNNGKLGGRPREFPKCPRYGSHRFNPKTKRCPCGYRRRA